MPSVGDPEALAAVTPKVGNNGADPFKILQPDQQVAKLAPIAVTGTYATDDTPIETAVNGLIAALVSVGIMKPS